MKKISIQRLAVLSLSLGLFFTSCKRYSGDFQDTNVNPGVTGSPIFGALMTNVKSAIAGYAAGTRGGLYCQYFSETQYTDVSLYSLPQINFEGEYSGILNDLQNIIDNGPNPNMKSVAKILKAYIFSSITDRWGDVPYSQALTGNGTPVFDRQSDIYNGLIVLLTAAVDEFSGTGAITGDVIYAGNVTRWRKFANSLRMRLALQLSKRYPAAGGVAAVQFNAALTHTAGIIENNADNFKVSFPGGNFKSPWYNLYDGRIDFGESETMTALMASLGDGRQAAYGSSALGVPYGRLRSYIDPWTSSNPTWARILNPSYRAENGTVVALSAAEVYLARAEAADRGWTAENMNTRYQEGVNASFAQWNLTPPVAAYFTQATVVLSAPAGTAANIRNLAIQQYVAGYPDGLRGWNIWRRTGWPVLTPAPDATNSSRLIPQRYTYGQQSYGSNTANVNAAATAIGGDNQDTKVWWAQ